MLYLWLSVIEHGGNLRLNFKLRHIRNRYILIQKLDLNIILLLGWVSKVYSYFLGIPNIHIVIIFVRNNFCFLCQSSILPTSSVSNFLLLSFISFPVGWRIRSSIWYGLASLSLYLRHIILLYACFLGLLLEIILYQFRPINSAF